MTSFRIILVVFSVLILVIATNAVYVHRISDTLTELVNVLPDVSSDNCIVAVNDLAREWRQAEKLISLSSGVERTRRINELLACLGVYAEKKDSLAYESARAVLKEAVSELSAMESFRLEDIF